MLEKDSRKFVVIDTHEGIYQYNRLPFGVASAPGIFQKVMENLLNRVPGVVAYVLITGKTEEQHLAALDEVLWRLSEAGLQLQRSKCVFNAPSVDYLGHRTDAQGLHPVADKMKAVQSAPTPRNVSELKSYLGLLSYYSCFLPNLSTLLAPLYKLLRHSQPWCWTAAQEKAFTESKAPLNYSFISTQLSILCWPVMIPTMALVRYFHIVCRMEQKSQLGLHPGHCLM